MKKRAACPNFDDGEAYVHRHSNYDGKENLLFPSVARCFGFIDSTSGVATCCQVVATVAYFVGHTSKYDLYDFNDSSLSGTM